MHQTQKKQFGVIWSWPWPSSQSTRVLSGASHPGTLPMSQASVTSIENLGWLALQKPLEMSLSNPGQVQVDP